MRLLLLSLVLCCGCASVDREKSLRYATWAVIAGAFVAGVASDSGELGTD